MEGNYKHIATGAIQILTPVSVEILGGSIVWELVSAEEISATIQPIRSAVETILPTEPETPRVKEIEPAKDKNSKSVSARDLD